MSKINKMIRVQLMTEMRRDPPISWKRVLFIITVSLLTGLLMGSL